MHLLLVISSLGGGGAERVMSRLAEGWAASGTQVTLATFESPSRDFYPLTPAIRRRSFQEEVASHKSFLPAVARRGQWLRNLMGHAQPDAVISFTDRTNVLTLAATQGLRIPVIVSERIDPTMYDPGKVWSLGRSVLYHRATAIVVQTRQIEQWSRQHFPRVPTAVIPNPAPDSVPNRHSQTAPIVLAVGRLTRQKGFDLLIQAFASVAQSHPEWQLRIMGEGEDRSSLETLISKLDMQGRIELLGRRTDAIEQIAAAGVFVLSSRFEGFPNVLLEAMAVGCPVISTDCRSGPADLIEHGNNGWLVSPEDPGALAAGLKRLLSDSELRRRLGGAARSVQERYSLPHILGQWNQLLSESCSRAQRRSAA